MKNEQKATGKELPPILDVELMKRLYEFGGLFFYRVLVLDEMTFKIREDCFTFNQEVAEAHKNWLIKHCNAKAVVRSTLVKFDGAFSLPQQQ